MKNSSEWTPEEHRMAEAHRSSVTKSTEIDYATVSRMNVDPNGSTANQFMRQRLTAVGLKLLDNGDVDGFSKLKGMLTAPRAPTPY